MAIGNGTNDQAAGLRRMANPGPVQVIAVTSGKGGVGKTNVSVNLAVALTDLGRRVMLLDADLGLANVDVMLGLHPKFNLSHVMKGECSLDEIVVEGPQGVRIVPASSGIKRMAEMSPAEHAGLVRAFSEVSGNIDTLIVDTAAGISDSVVSFSRASEEVIVVVCDEPASITDAYALIKLLSREYGQQRFHVLANMTQSPSEGKDLFTKITRVTDRFLEVTLDYMGAIPHDAYVRKAVQRQRAVVDAYPASKASQAFKQMARAADKWPRARTADGRLQFFFERLLRADAAEWQAV